MKNALMLVTIVLLCGPILMAQGDDGIARASLKGLSGVTVVIEDIRPDAIQDGLSKEEIQTDVGLRLRMAGIKVGDAKASSLLAAGSFGMLMVTVNTLKHSQTEIYAYAVDIDLQQNVTLVRDTQIKIFASTWSFGNTGMVGASHLSSVRDDVKDGVDKFINSWLSVNPKH